MPESCCAGRRRKCRLVGREYWKCMSFTGTVLCIFDCVAKVTIYNNLVPPSPNNPILAKDEIFQRAVFEIAFFFLFEKVAHRFNLTIFTQEADISLSWDKKKSFRLIDNISVNWRHTYGFILKHTWNVLLPWRSKERRDLLGYDFEMTEGFTFICSSIYIEV